MLCLACAGFSPGEDSATSIDFGVAGGSADAEFARRHDRRESKVREAHPKLGGLILALTDDPQPTRAWQSGAVGERRFGSKMAELGDAVVALHDRSVPRSRANIDHIVVGASGVFVVDAKHYKNSAVAVRRSGGLLGPARERLMVGGRDKTKLVEAMARQVDVVRSALARAGLHDVSVTPALCFVDGQFPVWTTLRIGEVHIRGLRGIAKLVGQQGPLDHPTRESVARQLATALPSKGSVTRR